MKDYKKEAEELLKDLKKWLNHNPDDKLVEYIAKELAIAHHNGAIDILKEAK